MKTKITKESRNLIIAMLLGDGTISNNFSFKIAHAIEQEEYLKWKIKQLHNHGVRNNGLKYYTSTSGYNIGKSVVYTQLNVLPIFKLLRKIMYLPKKKINNRRILNRLDSLGLAIWYMDDGHVNVSYNLKGNVKSLHIKIATCQSKQDNQIIIDYFKEVWNINFYQFSEGRGTYSIACGTTEAKKFVAIIKNHILEIPSMWYKIRNKMTKDEFNSYLVGNNITEMPNTDIC
jgi:hypothetical protein